MKKLATLMIILSLSVFTIGCGGGEGSSENGGAGAEPPAGEPSAAPTAPEGEETSPGE